jgi:hypothetical protein
MPVNTFCPPFGSPHVLHFLAFPLFSTVHFAHFQFDRKEKPPVFLTVLPPIGFGFSQSSSLSYPGI